MKTVIALLLCSSIAFGQAADAPLADPPIPDLPPPGLVLELGAGDVVPWDATCLDKPQAKRAAKLNAFHSAEAADLKKGNVILPAPAFIAIVAAGVVAVVVAGVALVKLAEKKPGAP